MSTTQHSEQPSSPYLDALHYIQARPASGSALSLAKLILSIWHRDNPFAFVECLEHMDGERIALAVRVVTHYANVGQDRHLGDIVERVHTIYPQLSRLADVMARARNDLQEQWRAGD